MGEVIVVVAVVVEVVDAVVVEVVVADVVEVVVSLVVKRVVVVKVVEMLFMIAWGWCTSKRLLASSAILRRLLSNNF